MGRILKIGSPNIYNEKDPNFDESAVHERPASEPYLNGRELRPHLASGCFQKVGAMTQFDRHQSQQIQQCLRTTRVRIALKL